jgi:hypothetical protein
MNFKNAENSHNIPLLRKIFSFPVEILLNMAENMYKIIDFEEENDGDEDEDEGDYENNINENTPFSIRSRNGTEILTPGKNIINDLSNHNNNYKSRMMKFKKINYSNKRSVNKKSSNKVKKKFNNTPRNRINYDNHEDLKKTENINNLTLPHSSSNIDEIDSFFHYNNNNNNNNKNYEVEEKDGLELMFSQKITQFSKLPNISFKRSSTLTPSSSFYNSPNKSNNNNNNNDNNSVTQKQVESSLNEKLARVRKGVNIKLDKMKETYLNMAGILVFVIIFFV